MLKTYKYWFFYKKETDELYAYTDVKEIAKLFKSQRNKNLFHCKKKEITKQEVRKLAEDENDKILSQCQLKYGDSGKIGNIDMVLTKTEKFTIIRESADLISSSIYKYTWINPFIFNDEIFESLEVLDYVNCNKLINSGNVNYLDIFSDADELGIFLRNFGNTL